MGKEYFSENYSETPFYEDGLWLLCVDNSEGKRRYGYLNEEFSWHIQPQYICAEAFYHGLAWCTDEQGYDQYIDTQGRVVWKSSMPRDIEKEKAALDAAGTWYRTDADNITYWMFIGVNDWREPTYDLQGRRVATPTRGIYIIQGRKVFIK